MAVAIKHVATGAANMADMNVMVNGDSKSMRVHNNQQGNGKGEGSDDDYSGSDGDKDNDSNR
jgi:hypothetical protein